jgi:hypothetical protein
MTDSTSNTTAYITELTQYKMFALLDKDIAFKDLDNEWKKSQEAHNQLTQKRANLEKELHNMQQQLGDKAINEWKKNKFIRTDADIKTAADLWCKNKKEAIIKYGHISDWNTTQVKDMSQLFYIKYRFNDDISKWDVSNVQDMSQMFHAYKWDPSIFNQDISGWDVSNVKDMQLMFYNAVEFNCDLSQWDVKNVVSMRFMFNGAKKFDGNISTWVLNSIDRASLIKGIYEDCNISSENQLKITYYSYSWDEEEDEYNEYISDISDEEEYDNNDYNEYDYADSTTLNYQDDHTHHETKYENKNNYYNLLNEEDEEEEKNEKDELSSENKRLMEIKEHNKIYDDYADGYDTDEENREWERRVGW